MLIKNYVPGMPGFLRIYADVSDIDIHFGSYSKNQTGPMPEPEVSGPSTPTTHICDDEEFMADRPRPATYQGASQLIDYTSKDGTRFRLRVTGYAYVCNDHGKTIETVRS